MATKPKTKRKSKTFAEQVEAYHKILEEQGAGYYLAKRRITPCKLAKEIEAHLKATCTKAFNYQGDIFYSDPLIDWTTRGRALELAVKLWGMMPPEKREVSGPDGGPIPVETRAIPAEVKELMDELAGRDTE